MIVLILMKNRGSRHAFAVLLEVAETGIKYMLLNLNQHAAFQDLS